MYVDANVRSVPDAYIDAQLRDLKPEADPPLEAYIHRQARVVNRKQRACRRQWRRV